MSYLSFVTNRPVVTILLIKLIAPKKGKLNGKKILNAFPFLSGIYIILTPENKLDYGFCTKRRHNFPGKILVFH